MTDIISYILSLIPGWVFITWFVVITIQESFIFILVVYGFYKWVRTEKALRDSPLGSLLNVTKTVVKDTQKKEPLTRDELGSAYLPPPKDE